jgi:hypothetical protein
MTLMLLEPAGGGAPPREEGPVQGATPPRALYITLGPQGAFKAGTCAHCVNEPGRPDRAWNADGDRDLDFERDWLFALLGELGIEIVDRQAYVCP